MAKIALLLSLSIISYNARACLCSTPDETRLFHDASQVVLVETLATDDLCDLGAESARSGCRGGPYASKVRIIKDYKYPESIVPREEYVIAPKEMCSVRLLPGERYVLFLHGYSGSAYTVNYCEPNISLRGENDPRFLEFEMKVREGTITSWKNSPNTLKVICEEGTPKFYRNDELVPSDSKSKISGVGG